MTFHRRLSCHCNSEGKERVTALKKKTIVIASIVPAVCIILLGILLSIQLIPAFRPVRFKDKVFEASIRKLIGKEEGKIRRIDLAGITEMGISGNKVFSEISKNTFNYDGWFNDGWYDRESISNGKIESLNDLRMFPELKKLSVCFQPLIDINAFKYLTNLKVLDLSNNNLMFINALEEAANLNELNLSGNKIKDISVLEKLSNLEVLNLSNNNIRDINALTSLTNLRVLDLSINDLGKISALEELTNLEILNLSRANVSTMGIHK